MTARTFRTPLLAGLVPLAPVAAACGDDDDAAATGDAANEEVASGEAAADGTGSGVDLPEGLAEVLDEMGCEHTSIAELPRTVNHDGGGLLSWQAHLAGGSSTDPGFGLIQKRPEVDVEAIAAARPDLINSHSGWLEGIEPRLRDLGVPVVVFAWGDEAPSWREDARIVAEASGRDACDDADVLFNLDFTEDSSTEVFLQQPTVAPVADRVRVLGPDLAGASYHPSPVGVRLFVHELEEMLG